MARFKKKPIEVDAVQLPERGKEYTKAKDDELMDFIRAHNLAFGGFFISDSGWWVTTVDENRVNIPWGAYCVIDTKGFAYPCDAEIFEANHDPI